LSASLRCWFKKASAHFILIFTALYNGALAGLIAGQVETKVGLASLLWAKADMAARMSIDFAPGFTTSSLGAMVAGMEMRTKFMGVIWIFLGLVSDIGL